MKFSTLTDRMTVLSTTGGKRFGDPEITAICYDSRKAVPGALFVAVEGLALDGHRFIPDALSRGAVAVVCSQPLTADAVVVRVADSRMALAQLSCRFYGQPSR